MKNLGKKKKLDIVYTVYSYSDDKILGFRMIVNSRSTCSLEDLLHNVKCKTILILVEPFLAESKVFEDQDISLNGYCSCITNAIKYNMLCLWTHFCFNENRGKEIEQTVS